MAESTNIAIGALILISIIALANLVVIFFTIFLILKLKNRLGVYICWIPSFVSFLTMVVLLFINTASALLTLFAFFIPYFIPYAVTAIVKIHRDKLREEKRRTEDEARLREQEELDKMSLQDL
jgi:predicted membrane protein